MVRISNQARNVYKIWQYPQVQNYANDYFYAYSRGPVFIAFTNVDQSFYITITYHNFKENTKLCNIFNTSDCLVVKDNQFTVYMSGGEVKIYGVTNQRKIE